MISVIVPMYNCEKYIGECLDSILGQGFNDYEVIIVNDGSRDASADIVAGFDGSKIHMVTQENRGLFHARLRGLRESCGDICLFVDGDDRLVPNALATVAERFDAGCDCVMYKTSLFWDENNRTEIEPGIFADETVFMDADRKDLLKILFTSGKINSIVCKAFRRNLIDVEKLEQYPRIAIGEDAMFTMELFANFKKAVYLDRALYLYRQQAGSMTHHLAFSMYADNVYRFAKNDLEVQKWFSGSELEQMQKQMTDLYFRMVCSLLLNPRFTVGCYSDYKSVSSRIAEDAYFKDKLPGLFQSSGLVYCLIIKFLAWHQYGLLYSLRVVLEKMMVIIRR